MVDAAGAESSSPRTSVKMRLYAFVVSPHTARRTRYDSRSVRTTRTSDSGMRSLSSLMRRSVVNN